MRKINNINLKLTECNELSKERDLLSRIAAKLKGRILFPEKVKSDREFLENIQEWPKELRSL